MARFSGRQYKGALRDYRLELRVEAEARQAAEQARDAGRGQERRRRAKVIWNSRANHRSAQRRAMVDVHLPEADDA